MELAILRNFHTVSRKYYEQMPKQWAGGFSAPDFAYQRALHGRLICCTATNAAISVRGEAV
ncbi:MAG TPA: hypothetical protein VHC39_11655 [Rhizomicrobium sp.]|nr:hypothetical protein [Rhizomicrobium sp.]